MDYKKLYYDLSVIYNSLTLRKSSLASIELGDIWKGKTSDKYANYIAEIKTNIDKLINNINKVIEAVAYINSCDTESSKIRTLIAQIESVEFQENFEEIYESIEYQNMIRSKETSERIKENYKKNAKAALEEVKSITQSVPTAKKIVAGFKYDNLMDPIKKIFKRYNAITKSVKLLNVTSSKSNKQTTTTATSKTNKTTQKNNDNTKFENILKTAKSCLGIKYVWGGSSPNTGFDCSGFVSWVINNSGNGINYGRLNANGLKNKCQKISAKDLKAGDLVFFQGTYNTSGASHVGIYVGDGKMIHCGNPVQYTSITSNYWKQHFLCYGRVS